MYIYQCLAGSQYPSAFLCWRFYLCLYSLKLYLVSRKTTEGFFLLLSIGMLSWAYVQLHPEGILHLWPHVETAWEPSPGRACRNIQENKNQPFCKKLGILVPICLGWRVPSNPTLYFHCFILFLMWSANTFSVLNDYSNLAHSHKDHNLWNPWRKLKQTLEV